MGPAPMLACAFGPVNTRGMRIMRTQHRVIREADRWWFDAQPPADGASQVRYIDWPNMAMPNAYVTWIVDDRQPSTPQRSTAPRP